MIRYIQKKRLLKSAGFRGRFLVLVCNLILDAMVIFYRPQQPKLLKLEYKTANGCIGCVVEIFLRLFGRELAVHMSGENKLP